MKRQSEIKSPQIVPAEQVFFGRLDLRGRFVAIGHCVDPNDPRPGFYGKEIRTSLLERIDLEEGVIETLNTIYKIV